MAMFVVSPADSEPLPAGGAWGGNHKICTTPLPLDGKGLFRCGIWVRNSGQFWLPFSRRKACCFYMNILLEQAVEKVQALPLEMQDQAARILLAYAGGEEPVLALTPEEEADPMEAQAEMQRGEFATDAEVEGVFTRNSP